jgi:hypothetical protein
LSLNRPKKEDWHRLVGFAPTDVIWARRGLAKRAGAIARGYTLELYATGASPVYLAGQLDLGPPPDELRWNAVVGTVWLARILCPSGMAYEAAFPAGYLGDTGTDSEGRRTTALPERVISTGGIPVRLLGPELTTARKIIKALPVNRGAAEPIDVGTDIDTVISGIKRTRENGHQVTKSSVAKLLFEGRVDDPRDTLKKLLVRIKDRSGHDWDALVHMATEG